MNKRGDSSMKIYLSEIDATPLLSPAEERALAGRVAKGDPYAREKLVKANLRLVVSLARGQSGKGVPIEDLISEGNLGLVRAAEGYDGQAETRFSTYASYWIKQSIRRVVRNEAKPIRLPAYMASLISKWRRASVALAERLGRPPTPEEIGKALRLSRKKLDIVAQAIKVNGLTVHPVGSQDDGGLAIEESLADDRVMPPDEALDGSERLSRALAGIDGLEAREAAVIRMRFGLGGRPPMDGTQIGNAIGLSRERVRQIEALAMARLIHSLSEEEKA